MSSHRKPLLLSAPAEVAVEMYQDYMIGDINVNGGRCDCCTEVDRGETVLKVRPYDPRED